MATCSPACRQAVWCHARLCLLGFDEVARASWLPARATCNFCCDLVSLDTRSLASILTASLCLLCSEGPGYIAWGHSTAVGPFAEILGTTGAPSWGSLASQLLSLVCCYGLPSCEGCVGADALVPRCAGAGEYPCTCTADCGTPLLCPLQMRRQALSTARWILPSWRSGGPICRCGTRSAPTCMR